MFTNRFKLFEVFGLKINADLSWFIIVLLVTWTLATGYFPSEQGVPGLSTTLYWVLGLITAALLFSSIVLHEMGHALMAQRFDVPIKGITLFIFGGVAEMSDEPPTAKSEFLVAVAGPVVSVILGVAFLALTGVGTALGWPSTVTVTTQVVGMLNVVIVLFNMIPAFPLDGGRVLRSILWHWKDNLRWATRVTSGIGAAFGIGLIGFGVVIAISGNLISGLWMGLIGFFVRTAAKMSYQQLLLRRSLEGEPVARFMETEVVTVPRSLSVRELVDDYVYRHHHKLYPVMDDDRLVGCVSTKEVRELPQEEWERQSVGSIAQPCSEENTIAPRSDAMDALSRMSRGGSSRLMVAEGEALHGILALKDLLEFFSLKMELEDRDALGGDDPSPHHPGRDREG